MKEWFFTFGFAHRHPETGEPLRNRFVRIKAERFDDARREMVARFGQRWSFQYETEADAGVERFHLTELT